MLLGQESRAGGRGGRSGWKERGKNTGCLDKKGAVRTDLNIKRFIHPVTSVKLASELGESRKIFKNLDFGVISLMFCNSSGLNIFLNT